MKRFCCLLICLILLLCACNTTPVSPEETRGTPETTLSSTSPETTLPAETEPEILQLPMSAIFMPLVTETDYAEDDTLLYTGIYQEVSLTMPDADCADQIILDLLNRIDDIRESNVHLKDWAREDYTGQEYWMPYTAEVVFSPVRMDEKVLSLYGINYSYAGGVHPNYNCISANYDLVTGKFLKLENVLVDKVASDKLCQLILDELAVIAEDYYLYDDYIRTVDERFGTIFDPTWESTDAWYLSTEGLGIFFSPYEIGPYASGPVELIFPYAVLEGIINPDYIPAPLPQLSPGTMQVTLAQDVDLDQFSQFAEAQLDTDGEQVVLYTDGLITDLILEVGEWDMDGISFNPKATVFTANSLTPGDAVILTTMFSDTMPHVRMRYDSDGVSYSFFLTQSGKDGSIILLDDLT